MKQEEEAENELLYFLRPKPGQAKPKNIEELWHECLSVEPQKDSRGQYLVYGCKEGIAHLDGSRCELCEKYNIR